MTDEPNTPLTTSGDPRTASEMDRPAPGPHEAGDPGSTFPRDEMEEGEERGRTYEPDAGATGAATPHAAESAREAAGGTPYTLPHDQAPAGVAGRPYGSGVVSGAAGAPQATDPGLADQAPGGPAERPAWNQGQAASAAYGSGAATGATGAAGVRPADDQPSLDRFRERWASVQGAFVDDPKAAVGEADRLVGEAIHHLEQKLTRHREHLQGQWSSGEPDTEQLRQFVHGYRALFNRLLEF